MSIVSLNTNTLSSVSQRSLNHSTGKITKSTQKLTTGKRINSAGDDVAALSINEKLNSQIRGITKAKQGIADGIGVLEQIDGVFVTIQDSLQSIKELAVQAYNGTNSEDEIDAIQREVRERVLAIMDMSEFTKFELTDLTGASVEVDLNVEFTEVLRDFNIVIGPNNETLTIEAAYDNGPNRGFEAGGTDTVPGTLNEGTLLPLDQFNVGSNNVGSAGIGIPPQFGRVGSLDDIDVVISNVSRMRSDIGKYTNALETRINYLDQMQESYSGANSHISDTDIAKESSSLLREQLRQQSAGAMFTQANAQAQFVLNLLP